MEKHSIEKIVDIINSEGTGYAVQHYLGYDNIQDEELARLWKIGEETLNAIESYIEKYMGEDFEWE